jgi:peptidoglycan hydrolase-like protein with peptidoglycan-binding domain
VSAAAIRRAQHELKSEGYYNGPVDGVDGPMTRAAIRNYQSANKLAVNGRLDNQTRSNLGSRPVRLLGGGYTIREYQKNSNLNVTGGLDQATLSSLGVSK